LLVINRDQWNDHKVRISFHDDKTNSERYFTGPVAITTFGRAQYQWHPDANGGSADPDGPAVKSTLNAGPDTSFELPQASIVVIRGSLGNKAGK